MKQAPQVILARDLTDRFDPWPLTNYVPETNSDGLVECTFSFDFYPARPKSKGGILTRVILAWGVFTGKYDALRWDNQ